MKTFSSVEAYGSIFVFEPPVSVRHDESTNISLARLATIAWYGTEYPRGFAHQTCEEGFLQAFDDLHHDPQLIAQKITETLQGKFIVTLVEQ